MLLAVVRGWGFEPLNLVPVGHGIVERIAGEIRHRELVAAEEMNDSLIIAEAALLECRMLLSGDAHSRGVDVPKSRAAFEGFSTLPPRSRHAREIARKFFP